MYRSHDFTGSGTDHRETKNAIIAVANKSFHKTLSLVGRLRAKDGVHWQACNAGYHTLAFRFALAQPDAGERGIDEHAIWHQTIARASISAREIVAYDSKIVLGDVGELWTAGAFTHGPNAWRTCLQSGIHPNVTAAVQFYAGLLKSNSRGIRNAPNRDQDIAAIDMLLGRFSVTLSPDRPLTWSSSAPTRT